MAWPALFDRWNYSRGQAAQWFGHNMMMNPEHTMMTILQVIIGMYTLTLLYGYSYFTFILRIYYSPPLSFIKPGQTIPCLPFVILNFCPQSWRGQISVMTSAAGSMSCVESWNDWKRLRRHNTNKTFPNETSLWDKKPSQHVFVWFIPLLTSYVCRMYIVGHPPRGHFPLPSLT